MLKVNFKKLNDEAIKPKQAHKTDAGSDLYSIENKVLNPGEFAPIKTGIAVEIPAGKVGKVAPRSGLAFNYGIIVLNAEGTIDSGYRGEIKVILINHGKIPYMIKKGERIAQLIIHSYDAVSWQEKEKLRDADRGVNGFGSTGKYNTKGVETGRLKSK